jgi:hypothetical protein
VVSGRRSSGGTPGFLQLESIYSIAGKLPFHLVEWGYTSPARAAFCYGWMEAWFRVSVSVVGDVVQENIYMFVVVLMHHTE